MRRGNTSNIPPPAIELIMPATKAAANIKRPWRRDMADSVRGKGERAKGKLFLLCDPVSLWLRVSVRSHTTESRRLH
jgi:hypothetical protein